MIVPVVSERIPETRDLSSIEARLKRLVSESRAFIVRATAEHSGLDAVNIIRDIVQGHDGELEEYTEAVGDREIGWHFDRAPKPGANLDFNVHRTLDGIARAQLILPRARFWSRNSDEPSWMDNYELLELGQVDDTCLEPLILTGDMDPEDVLVFPTGGAWPTVHKFTNRTASRASEVYRGFLVVANHL